MDHNRLLAQNRIGGLGIQPGSGVDATNSMEKIINEVIGVLTIVAVIYFIIQIILAGYAFISSEGDKNKMETARKRLTDGILGLTVIVLAVTLAGLLAHLTGLGDIFDLSGLIGNIIP